MVRKDVIIGLVVLIIIIVLSVWNYYFHFQEHNPASMTITFKMDDVQDFWQSDKQQAIISLHIQRRVPIKIAVVAGLFGQDELLKDLIIDGVSQGMVDIQNHGWNAERIENKSYIEQLQIIFDASDRIKDLLGVAPSEFMPHELAYDENTIKALYQLNMKLAVDEPDHVFVTEYLNRQWEPFDLNKIVQIVRRKVDIFGHGEIYIHFQALTFEQYHLLFNVLAEEYDL
jgi:hypothetical protein